MLCAARFGGHGTTLGAGWITAEVDFCASCADRGGVYVALALAQALRDQKVSLSLLHLLRVQSFLSMYKGDRPCVSWIDNIGPHKGTAVNIDDFLKAVYEIAPLDVRTAL